jgi:hypothetical protein
MDVREAEELGRSRARAAAAARLSRERGKD